MEERLESLRQEIVDKSLEAFREGLFSGTSGNMSCRVAPDEMLITPTSVRYDMLRAQDIVRMKLARHGARRGVAALERVAHARGGLQGVWRDERRLPHALTLCHGVCRRAEEHPRGVDRIVHSFWAATSAARTTPRRGLRPSARTPIPALKDRGGCTLANHGVLAVGKDLAQAYLRAEYIEDVAKVYTFSKWFSARRWSLPLFNEKNSAETAQGEYK